MENELFDIKLNTGLLSKEFLNMMNDIKFYKNEKKVNSEIIDDIFNTLK